MSRFLSCVVPTIAIGFLLAFSRTTSAQTAHAVLTSPPDGHEYTWSFFLSNYPSITISCANVYVSSTGTANADFYVSWNMYLKEDGVSLVTNDSSHGYVLKTYNTAGYWERQGWGSGSNSFTSDYNETFTTHRAEASANLLVDTYNVTMTDTHTFYVLMTYY